MGATERGDYLPDLEKVIQASTSEYLAGIHCSEVIFKNVTREWQPGFDTNLVRIATPFGGGIADREDACGALVGGMMVIGYLFGRRSLDESQDFCQELSRKFYDSFKANFCATICRSIKDRIPVWDEQVKCSQTVRQSITILWQLLDDAQKAGRISRQR